MKQKTINLYEFSELSEQAQKRALRDLCDVNTDYNWWEFLYDQAREIGVQINGFDIDRGTIQGAYCAGFDGESVGG